MEVASGVTDKKEDSAGGTGAALRGGICASGWAQKRKARDGCAGGR